MKQVTGIQRAAVLALFSLACALGTGLAALYALTESLPPSDGAYGQSVLQLLLDPFVLMVWAPLTLGGALLGWLVSLLTLRRANLLIAIPLVSVVTLIVAALAASSSVLLAPPAAFGAALLAMQLCHLTFSNRDETPPQESVFRQGLKSLDRRDPPASGFRPR